MRTLIVMAVLILLAGSTVSAQSDIMEHRGFAFEIYGGYAIGDDASLLLGGISASILGAVDIAVGTGYPLGDKNEDRVHLNSVGVAVYPGKNDDIFDRWRPGLFYQYSVLRGEGRRQTIRGSAFGVLLVTNRRPRRGRVGQAFLSIGIYNAEKINTKPLAIFGIGGSMFSRLDQDVTMRLSPSIALTKESQTFSISLGIIFGKLALE